MTAAHNRQQPCAPAADWWDAWPGVRARYVAPTILLGGGALRSRQIRAL